MVKFWIQWLDNIYCTKVLKTEGQYITFEIERELQSNLECHYTSSVVLVKSPLDFLVPAGLYLECL